MDEEGTNLEEFTIGRGEPSSNPIPRPLELLARMGVELELIHKDRQRPLRVGSLDNQVFHIGPSRKDFLLLRYDQTDNHSIHTPEIDYGSGTLWFKFHSHQHVTIYWASGLMPQDPCYYNVDLSDYNRRLTELRERRTGGAGSEV